VFDDAIWVGVLTGTTAVIASLVAGRGQANAARVQAEITARSQQVDRRREARRTAYVDFIESTHRMGALYWKISEASAMRESTRRATALEELRRLLQAEYATLRRCVRVIDLEGSDDVAHAAESLKAATDVSYRAFRDVIDGEQGAAQRFDEAYEPFWDALRHFVDVAKSAVRDM
jgi:hypothetical protein